MHSRTCALVWPGGRVARVGPGVRRWAGGGCRAPVGPGRAARSGQVKSRQLRARVKLAVAAALILAAVLAAVLIGAEGGGRRRQAPGGPQPASLGPAALPIPSSPAFGANVNRLFNDGTYTPAQIRSQLAALRRTGATIARSDALWEASEPEPGIVRLDIR